MSFFPTAVQKFQNFFFKKCSADVFKYVVSLGPSDDAVKFLFPIFVEYCLEEFPNEIKRFRGMIESADLTKPHTWFPFARAMKRKIIYHCGTTNSCITYNALQRFMEAKKGIYCSHLKLLAMEVFDKGLSLENRFNFCLAPVNIRDPEAMYHLLRFASAYSQNVPVNIAMGMPKGSPQNDSELLDLETKRQVLSMHMWLSNHFKEETFPYVKKAEAMATDIADLLGQSLTKANWKPKSRQAGKPKPQRKDYGYERPRSFIQLYER
ncbi:hypothetical protein CMV_018357 [Castanea mollissima]|uniref:RNA helicase n=1 Tax=Castanea mollissima TaxID=60419 RepID=A0A8J4QRP2_9ROSI|nr:hypothetical protein CMV_018357 [Castanea mollissima]